MAPRSGSATGPSPVLDPHGQPDLRRTAIARLKVVQANPGDLVNRGEPLRSRKGDAPAGHRKPQRAPELVEQSNVNPVLSLVQLMTVSRRI